MKKTNKKGFTIVELVIVIAVIAILSAVLIPTFGGVITDANEASRDMEAKNIYTSYVANIEYDKGQEPGTEGYILVDGYLYTLTKGNVTVDGAQTKATAPTDKCYKEVAEGLYVVVACTSENGHTHKTTELQ